MTGPDPTSPIEVIVHKKEMSKEQQTAMEKLKKLQEEMIDGGKRAGDKNLKERRKQKKRAAENRYIEGVSKKSALAQNVAISKKSTILI